MTSIAIKSLCLITGANGFIGSALLSHLQQQGMHVRGAIRQPPTTPGNWTQITALTAETDWRNALVGCDTVVHLAGRAHILRESDNDPLTEFRRINVDATLALASQALEMGIRRFVYISSIGVHGQVSLSAPFSEEDTLSPYSPYTESKLEAEQALQALLKNKAMEFVIIRAPLVYSAHAPGNFRRILTLVKYRLPLPFSLIKNSRNMLALENLVDFIHCCLIHPAAANQVFLVADETAIRTTDLINLLAQGMQRKIIQLPIPASILAFAAQIIKREYLYNQLCGNLEISIDKAKNLLGWQPPQPTIKAVTACAKDYIRRDL